MQERIKFSSQDVRLAIIQFGSLVQTDLTFEQSTDGNYNSLVQHIEGIKRLEGRETNTAKALAEAKTYFDNHER